MLSDMTCETCGKSAEWGFGCRPRVDSFEHKDHKTPWACELCLAKRFAAKDKEIDRLEKALWIAAEERGSTCCPPIGISAKDVYDQYLREADERVKEDKE